jgi:hypothetical protein
VNPLFFEAIDLNYEVFDPAEMPPLIVDVFDFDDGIIKSEEFLARAVINVQDIDHSSDNTI